ncbi:hypothetical protein ACI2L4_10155 [Streptomyces sparsogenes]|uniref:hypothetical protein n=1 Tax=Streptomyces sparsogenes TaxID=67365 RepID=UPI00384E0EF7
MRSIEEALARARIFKGAQNARRREASRRRITRELAELRWMQQMTEHGVRSALPDQSPSVLHERAAQDLRALCQSVIHDADAAGRLNRFETTRDPGGALAFACLLVLANEEQGAQFWWQFAAGAGNATGALCLHLLHLCRGELRDAHHWAQQTILLEDWPCQYAPVAHEVVDAAAPAVGVAVHIELSDDGATVSENAVRDAIEDLDVRRIEDFGAIHQPSPRLAHQLEDLVSIGN